MKIHILGICGTFMGGLAQILIEKGHQVSGSDHQFYPPMSDQLDALGVEMIQGYDIANICTLILKNFAQHKRSRSFSMSASDSYNCFIFNHFS